MLKRTIKRALTPPPNQSVWSLSLLAGCCAAISVFVGESFLPDAGTIPVDRMIRASGQVTAVYETRRSGIQFHLSGHPQLFRYMSCDACEVKRALLEAGQAEVSVGRDPETVHSVFSDDQLVSVWEISVGGVPVRTWQQTQAHMRERIPSLRWTSVGLMLLAVHFAFLAWKKRQREKYPFD